MRDATLEVEPIVDLAAPLISAVQSASAVHTREELAHWLRASIQQLIPYAYLLVGWGDHRRGTICYDLVCSRAHGVFPPVSTPEARFLVGLAFEQWNGQGHTPSVIDLRPLKGPSMSLSRPNAYMALVHGAADYRGDYECLYVFVGTSQLDTPRAKRLATLLVPSIDAGFRQTTASRAAPSAGNAGPAVLAAHESPFSGRSEREKLSARELEIMKWVRIGKTNSEIAQILGLSTFTVKNHMRRIYQKLDVLNRAQAVDRLGSSY